MSFRQKALVFPELLKTKHIEVKNEQFKVQQEHFSCVSGLIYTFDTIIRQCSTVIGEPRL